MRSQHTRWQSQVESRVVRRRETHAAAELDGYKFFKDEFAGTLATDFLGPTTRSPAPRSRDVRCTCSAS